MFQASLRRINAEYLQLSNLTSEDKLMFEITSNNENMYNWKATIYGPSDSLYQNYKFHLDINIPSEYPMKAPSVKFISPILHVNVNDSGNICLDILKSKWSPVLKISTVLISIVSLLGEPNPSDPFNNELAQLYRRDENKYTDAIKAYCQKNCESINNQ